jgi:putative oxidoreductase
MNATTSTMLRHLTPERGFDLIRIYLGIGLTVRGVLFLMNPDWISNFMATSGQDQLAARLIALGHIGGGALLGLGLFTRFAAAIQVVPVFGALVMLHSHEGLASPNQSLEFSALVLIMLVFFACFGAGQWSLDQQRRSHRASAADSSFTG